jgi:hypothetical protein
MICQILSVFISFSLCRMYFHFFSLVQPSHAFVQTPFCVCLVLHVRGSLPCSDVHSYTTFIILHPRFFLWFNISFTHLLYTICRICNKCVCSISTGSWMSYVQWRNPCTPFSFCSLRFHFNSCTGGFTQVSLVQLRGVSFQSVCSFAIV